jgi:DNA-binding response OmpR family regulator
MQNLYESVWNEPFFSISANTVMVHIRKLRAKIEDEPKDPKIIKTVWGKGYRVEKET